MRPRGRERTSTAAGVRRPCSAATIGPKPIATRTDKAETPRARSEPTMVLRSCVAVTAAAGSAWVKAATFTPAGTVTSTGTRAARGRSTTTATGRTRTDNLVNGRSRSTARAQADRLAQPARWIAASSAPWIAARGTSSIAIRPRVVTARSDRNHYGNYRGGSGMHGTGSFRGGSGGRAGGGVRSGGGRRR